MAKTATMDTSASVDQELKKTNFGNFVRKNRSSLITLFIVILVAVIGSLVYFQRQQNAREDALGQATAFQQASVSAYLEDKINEEQFWDAFQTYAKTFPKHRLLATTLFPDILEISTRFVQKNKNDLALQVLLEYDGVYQSSNYGFAIWARNLASLHENNNQNDKAIKILERLTQSPHKVFHAQAYLDLGRLNLKLGNKEQATKHFDYLQKNFADKADLVKLAQIYQAGF